MEFPAPINSVVEVIHQPKPIRPHSAFKILTQSDNETQPGDEPQSRDEPQLNIWPFPPPVPSPPHRDEHADTCTWPARGSPFQCRITDLGHAIYAGNRSAMRRALLNGASPNAPCHSRGFNKAEYPLGLVTSRRYHERTDECFHVLVMAGVEIESQFIDKKDLSDLIDQLFLFAFRPIATFRTLRAVLAMKIDFTEQRRDRLRELAKNQAWYHGDIDGKEIWSLQYESAQLQRQRILSSRFSREEITPVSTDSPATEST